MTSIKILTDSASDITRQEAEESSIHLFHFPFIMEGETFHDGVDFTPDELYQALERARTMPTHAQITMFEYREAFSRYYQEGYTDLIYVCINGSGSGTINAARLAKEEFFAEHPEADGFSIHILDSRTYTMAYGFPVLEAAAKARRDCSVAEILSYLEDQIGRAHIFFAPYTLRFVKKSGRVSAAAAFAGELMGLRPLITFEDGNSKILSKVRGEKAIIPALLKLAQKTMVPQTPYGIVYGSLQEPAEELAHAAEKMFGAKPAYLKKIGAMISINAGPQVIAIIVSGKHGRAESIGQQLP